MKKFLLAGGAVILAVAVYGAFGADRLAGVAAAYKAKTLCSEVFVAGRKALEVEASDFQDLHPALVKARVTISANEDAVHGSLYGLGRATATFRAGHGCTIEAGGPPAALAPVQPVAPTAWAESLPQSPLLLRRVDYAAMEAALDAAMQDSKARHRALLVVVDGRIVAERYGDGFDAAVPFLSWSMAKSVTATIVGAAALHGLVDIGSPAPAPEWSKDARRAAITWNDLLRMQSGLEFSEEYENPASDVNRMLFASRDAGMVAAKKKLAHDPGARWYYSSGTSNLLARSLRQALAARDLDYTQFARDAVFAPIGAASFVLEPDSAGTHVGSSFVYATVRDWAKLGQLYLQDGVWEGKRVLPEGWADYVSNPTAPSDGEYGAHFWLNQDGAERRRFVPGLPQSVYYMAGHEGQYVFVIPDKNAVIVRLGQTRGAVPIDVAGPVAAQLYAAIDDVAAENAAAFDDL